MVKIGYKKVFTDPEKLGQLTAMREAGWSVDSLARFFGCSKSSIFERVNNIPLPRQIYTVESIVSTAFPEPPKSTWRFSGGERTNMGRSYKDYLMSN